MAVSGNTEEVKTVLTIDTTKSASSMKELRTQIKELKDELVGLDQGTEEYQNTVVQLGEKMHQLKEINEEVRRTNSDFGDTLGNISNVMAGGVAAVQGLTAGLSLLGIEMGDDNKLTQTLVKSMALLQSLGSMEKAIKSFKALSLVIKSNITAAGGLGKALKALAVSNPFGVMLVAATALVGVISAIIGKTKEAKKETETYKVNVDDLVASFYDLAGAMDNLAVEDAWIADNKTQTEVQRLLGKFTDFQGQSTNAGRDAEHVWRDFRHTIMETGTEAEKALLGLANAQRNYEESVWAINRARQYAWDSESERQEAIRAATEASEKLNQRRLAVYKQYTQAQNKSKNNSKVERDLEKEKYDLALKRLNLQKTLDETELTARYEAEKRAAQGNAQQLLAIEEKYQTERKILNERYYKSAIALAEEFKKTRKKESDIVDIDQTIANLNKSLQEGADAWEAYKIENAEANVELERTKIDAQATIDSLDRQTAAMEREIEITKAHNERYLALIKEKWTLQADLNAEAIRYEQEQLENSNVGIDDEIESLRTKHEAEMTLLQEQYDAKLIAEEEFQQQKAELEANYNNETMGLLQQRFENEARLDELEVEAEKNKIERKKELNEAFASAMSGIMSSINGILNAALQDEDMSLEEQKKIKTAQAIMSTFEAANSAYSAMASIPYVGPALGVAAAAAAVIAGMINVKNIQKTKKGSSASSANVSTSAVQTVQMPTQMTNITGFSDNIELPDQRVYVLESDITNAQNHVQVVESNSSF